MVSTGINVFSKDVLEFIPRGQYLDIPVLMVNLLRAKKLVLTYLDEYEWFDIGRPDDYEKAISEFEKSKDKYL